MTELAAGIVREAESRLGVPREAWIEQRLLDWELELIERVCGNRRFHDLTVFVLAQGRLAMVHKPSEPEGVFWVPAGGLHPGESMAEGAAREVREETGLEVEVQRYLLRVHARFHQEHRSRPWTSHVFLARPTHAAPQNEELTPLDTREVESAAWLTLENFLKRTVPVLKGQGWGRFEYRLGLARLALAELGLPTPES